MSEIFHLCQYREGPSTRPVLSPVGEETHRTPHTTFTEGPVRDDFFKNCFRQGTEYSGFRRNCFSILTVPFGHFTTCISEVITVDFTYFADNDRRRFLSCVFWR